ncbi:MAG TPA: TonB family protein [Terriglobales bacterium]|nr:TonB family protein [Terriglobales bacterium]
MTDNWKAWEGRIIDGKFVLGTYLGGLDRSAVFRTRVGGAEAAIKLVAAAGTEAERQLRRWKAASQLTHPNLIRISTMGECAVEGSEVVYAVEEAADENLGQIIPERALTSDEVRGMIGPVLEALEYLHGKGLVHERIRPSNILAAGDQVKLSSDNLGAAGEIPHRTSLYDAPEVQASGISTASEIWSLGMALVEVLTQRAPGWDVARESASEIGADIPEPFREIARRCLEVDPAKRCDVREIRERLEGKREAAGTWKILPAPAGAEIAVPSVSPRPLRWIVGVVVVIALILAGLWLRSSRTSEEKSRQERASAPEPAQTQPASPASGGGGAGANETQPEEKAVAPAPEAGDRSKTAASGDEIVERVMPDISASARRTISGKIKVRVRVRVNARGDVEEATLKGAGPSRYFAHKAVEAAEKWKFAPAGGGGPNREWMLLFVFSRSRTDVVAARARR